MPACSFWEDSRLPALGGYITNLGNMASAAFAMPVLLIAMLVAGFAWATGNRNMAQAWAIGGLIGTGIVLAAPQIVATIPKPA